MLQDILKYKFLQNALICSVLISILCGIVGTIIVHKKLVMLTGGIAHTSFGGVGLGYLLGIEPIIGALGFAVLASLGIGVISKKSHQSSNIATAVFWSTGMALGILFIALAPGYPPDITSYLFGNILSVSRIDLVATLVWDVMIILLVIGFYNYIKAYLFDEQFAAVIKIRTVLLDNLLYIAMALTIVLLIHTVGIMLIMVLIAAPPAIARLFSSSLIKIMILSALICLISCIAGLWISYIYPIASGASIVMFTASLYIVSYGINRLKLKLAKKAA